jgi:glycerol uptake facilitator-like aquaporin
LLLGLGCILAQLLASFLAAVLVPLLFEVGTTIISTKTDHDIFKQTLVLYPYPNASAVSVFVMEVVLSILFVFINIMISYDPDYVPPYKRVYTMRDFMAVRDNPHALLLFPESEYDYIRIAMENVHPQPPPVTLPESYFKHMLKRRHATTQEALPIADSHYPLDIKTPLILFHIQQLHDRGAYLKTLTTKAFSLGMLFALIPLCGNTVSGCGINPARAFGPALAYDAWGYQWTYWAGGVLGTIIATQVYEIFYTPAMGRLARTSAAEFRKKYYRLL